MPTLKQKLGAARECDALRSVMYECDAFINWACWSRPAERSPKSIIKMLKIIRRVASDGLRMRRNYRRKRILTAGTKETRFGGVHIDLIGRTELTHNDDAKDAAIDFLRAAILATKDWLKDCGKIHLVKLGLKQVVIRAIDQDDFRR